ncbi:MAG: 3-methyladenine DNA glycosylase [Verrucomicrobiota bacterium]
MPKVDWERCQENHSNALSERIQGHLCRQSRAEKHPIYDFLFEYYSFRASHLIRWTPGVGVILENADLAGWSWGPFVKRDQGIWLDASLFPRQRREGLNWTLQLLQEINKKPPFLACFGLHEWAMVTDVEDVRHQQLPLRLSHHEIVKIVKNQSICCTHFDAFRFFSKTAKPWNHYQPTTRNRRSLEQPGCIHANMDLYKWAYKFYPWISSDILRDAFDLAWKSRVIDMQASPYDVSMFGYEAIKIETESGRQIYQSKQKELSEIAKAIRERLIETMLVLKNS